jgi:nitroreductase
MDLFEAINRRHSYRGEFKPDPVPDSDLQSIVEAGIKAPSGCNAQTTNFIIVTNSQSIKEIGEIAGYPFVKNAPALIVCAVSDDPVYHGLSFKKEDCAAAVENMLLAITALGYASVWVDGALRREKRAEKIGELLNLPKDRSIQVILPVGIPAESRKQKEKKSFSERASWF